MNLEIKNKMDAIYSFLSQSTGRKPKDLNGVLFLIGVQELGKGVQVFSKEEKQDLIHIAICKVLSFGGYYILLGIDINGWPHWELIKPLPAFDLLTQEQLLKHYIIEYFKTEIGLHI